MGLMEWFSTAQKITIQKINFPPRTNKNTGLNTGVDASIAIVRYIKMNKKKEGFSSGFHETVNLDTKLHDNQKKASHIEHEFPQNDETQNANLHSTS